MDKILLSLGYRGRGYADGYRLFNNEEELLEFVKKHKTNESLQEQAWYRYAIFSVGSGSSKSIKRKYSKKIREIIQGTI